MNEYEKIAVEEILRYNQDGMFFFYQKKFLKAAFATGLPFAHERAQYLKELYNRWQRELKREKRETQKLRNEASKTDKRSGKTRKKTNKNSVAYRRMKAAYFRWYHHKTSERMAVYIALKEEYKAERRMNNEQH